MSKKVARICRLQFPAEGARPGPVLTSAGINMPQFRTVFNDATKERAGDVVPVIITVHKDKSFDFVTKATPAAMTIRKTAGIKKAPRDQKKISGKITVDQLREVAEYETPGLNVDDAKAAMRIVAGITKDMGIEVEGFE